MVTALIEHKRTEEEFLILAQAKEIADNSFRPAAGMIAAQPELAVLCKVNTYHREIVQIVHRRDGSSILLWALNFSDFSNNQIGWNFFANDSHGPGNGERPQGNSRSRGLGNSRR
jgi:hypothetical protein